MSHAQNLVGLSRVGRKRLLRRKLSRLYWGWRKYGLRLSWMIRWSDSLRISLRNRLTEQVGGREKGNRD
jgi:hypothetical protein